MHLAVIENRGQGVGEGAKGQPLLSRTSDTTRLVEACANAGVNKLVLYPENLTPKFFDLSSREAGEVLGKLREYYLRLAVIRTPGLVLSSRFSEILGEERRAGYFGLFNDRQAALDWLTQD